MNMMQENAIEDSKYAFLLGSALRDDDTDQVLTIYDNLIPSDISSRRLQHIKEEARRISELPEENFNALVLNARDFSLASGHYSMSGHTGSYSSVEDEESRFVGDSMADGTDIPVTSSDSFALDLRMGEDSGLPTSKATGSLPGSIDVDDYDNDGERIGVIDYMPDARSHVKITHLHNPHYDEEVKASSSTGESSIESPRSDNSSTHEEYTLPARELDDLSGFDYIHDRGYLGRSEHQHLYHPNNRSMQRYFMSDEELERDTCRKGSSRFSRPAEVDEYCKIDMALGHTQKAEALRSSYNCRNDPTFQSDLQKNKKKVGIKDDSDKSNTAHMIDVNGNPQSFDLSTYSQMRTHYPSKVENSSTPTTHTISNQENSKFEEKKRARERKKQKERSKLVKSEDNQNYYTYGNKDLNFLLEYIEGKSAKGSPTANHSSASSVPAPAQVADKQPTAPDTPVSVKGEKAKKKTEKTATKERQNEADEKQADIPLANGQVPAPTAVVSQSGESTMGNSSAKDGQGDVNVVIPRTIPKMTPSFESSVQEDESSASDKLPKETVQPKAAIVEEKTSIVNSSSSSEPGQDAESEKTHVINNSKRPPKSKDTKGAIPSKKEKGVSSLRDNQAPCPEAATLTDTQIDFIAVDSSLSSDAIPDFELNGESKREPAFTEVKKKKKRTGTKEISLPYVPTTHSIPSSNNNNFMYKNNGTPFRPRPRAASPPVVPQTNHAQPITASNTIIPVSQSTSGLPINHLDSNHSLPRDLSPSAFPVLSGHGKPSSARSDGRRNSCGDISTDIVDTRILYDSDKESVKSLPAAHDTSTAGDSSPVYHISYASMAAAPRRSDISKSPSSESGVASGSQNGSINGSHPHSSMETVSTKSPGEVTTPERKTTVWKGSPRERRHSEGDNSSVNSRSRQKSGSQECLAAGILSTQDSSPSSSPNAIHASCSSNSLPSDVDLQDGVASVSDTSAADGFPASPNPPVMLPSAKPTLSGVVPPSTYANQAATSGATQATPCKDGKTPSPSQSPVSNSSSDSGQKDKISGPTKVTTKPPAEVEGENSQKSAAAPIPKKTPPPESSKKGASATNNSKSVIFLDKRFGGKCQNLGITFGFDSSIQATSDAEDKPTVHSAPLSPVVSTSSSSPAAISPSSVSSTSSAGSQSPSSSQISSSSIPSLMATPQLPAFVSPHPAPLSDLEMGKNNSMKSQVPKAPHIAGLSNGIILPAQSAILVPTHSASVASQPGPDKSKQSSVTSTCSRSSSSNNNSSQVSSCNHSVISTISPSVCNPNSKAHPLTSSKCLSNSSPIAASTTNTSVGDVQNPSPSPQSAKANSGTSTTCTTVTTAAAATAAAATTTTTTMVAVPGGAAMQPASTIAAPTSSSVTPSQSGLAEVTMATNAKLQSSKMANLPSLPKESPTKTVSSSKAPPNGPELSAKYAHTVRVVYGLKIKPQEGCGSVFFRPTPVPKRHKQDNASQVISFLKRQWAEVDPQKKHSPAFITVADN